MQHPTGLTQSLWIKSMKQGNHVPLTHDLETEVCIIGGGLSGLITAFKLLEQGITPVILESKEPGAGDTLRTTAHLASVLDDRFKNLSEVFGEDGARLARESHEWAITEIDRICQVHKFDEAMFRRVEGYLFAGDKGSEKELREELEYARKAGFGDIGIAEFGKDEVGWPMGTAIRFPNQGQFNPAGYIKHLIEHVTHHGVHLYINTHVTQVDQSQQPIVIHTAAGPKVTARHLVVATNTPINTMVSMHTLQAPYRTYAIGAVVPRNSVKYALYWDMEDPYHYVRLQPFNDQDMLIIGGEDHKTGQESDPAQHIANLKEWGKKHFPMIERFDFEWSGQVMEPYDHLAYLGQMPGLENVYVITGDSGHGMTHSHIGAQIITDLITGHTNAWAEIYSPSRVKFKAGQEYVKENLNVVAQLKDYFTGSEVESFDALPPGEGAVFRQGLTKLAVYKDPKGEVHKMTAICPHMACVVHWNNLEKTWDCPCHGSRFTATGTIIQGPATSSLKRIED